MYLARKNLNCKPRKIKEIQQSRQMVLRKDIQLAALIEVKSRVVGKQLIQFQLLATSRISRKLWKKAWSLAQLKVRFRLVSEVNLGGF